MIDKAQKNVNAVSQSTLHTLSMKLLTVTMHTLIAPGHADVLKNMITGAAQMDGAILLYPQLTALCLKLANTSCWLAKLVFLQL